MTSDALLAKSPHNGREKTLVEHTQDVIDAAESLFGTLDAPTRLASCWMRLFRLQDFRSFAMCLSAAAALHDIGKANRDFQETVRGGKAGQLLRHEHLSALMMLVDSVEGWLRKRTDIDWDIVLAAVVCHHLKADPDTELCSPQASRSKLLVNVLTDHRDFQDLLSVIGDRLDLPGVPREIPTSWLFERSARPPHQSAERLKDRLIGRLNDLEDDIDDNEVRGRLLRAVRGALIVVDSVGSAAPRMQETVAEWIHTVFAADDLRSTDDVWKAVINPRIAELEKKGRWTQWSDFQIRTAELPRRSLLLAPCGSGKTLAAWRWLATLAGSGIRHCLFLYPTRATATEGFRDYVSWAPEATATVMHGSAAYELESMFENPDERSKKSFETQERLFALGYWRKRFFSATVDQFLAFLQYGYASVCMLPVLADAAIVIDEVHSFDPAMFSALTDFLSEFDVPVLCMTATLPAERRTRLQNCGLTVLDAYEEEFGDLREISEAPRYRVLQSNQPEAYATVRKALINNQKVLWVTNTVARAQKIARELAHSVKDGCLQTKNGIPVYCYHSRYRLSDRKEWHNRVVEAFNPTAGKPVLAVTTQVCEMGLDLDADLLVTELAPITALIQRMGRCNRSRRPRENAGTVLVYQPEKEKPYEQRDLFGVDEFLESVSKLSTISQTQLEAALRASPKIEERSKAACQFLRSGPYASSGVAQFRDIEEFTLPTVLESDLLEVTERTRDRKPIDGYIVPVPRRFRSPAPSSLPNYIGMAKSDYYVDTFGFCDELPSAGDALTCQSPKPPLIA